MTTRRVELVYFDGCPNAAAARENLRAAFEQVGRAADWAEWNLMDDATPEHLRAHGSPTVLIDGEDVTGGGEAAVAMACRADGAPSVDTIRARLGG